MQFPEDETEFRLLWSAQGGKVAILAGVVAKLEEGSGKAYIRGQDDVAKELRCTAAELKREHARESAALDEYIKEDQRREAEFQRVMHAPRPAFKFKRGK